jgi:hypothetical protein
METEVITKSEIEDLANPAHLARRMIEIAGARREKMIDEDMSEEDAYVYVKDIIGKATVVFGVYPESSNTFGLRIIKGNREMQVLMASNEHEAASHEDFAITAIPCLDIDQAKTVEDELGDGLLKAN